MSSYESAAVKKLSPETKAQAVEAARPAVALIDRATSHRPEFAHGTTSQSDGREAMMHTQGAPGKTQSAMSPTDSHKGQTHTQQRQQSRSRSIER